MHCYKGIPQNHHTFHTFIVWFPPNGWHWMTPQTNPSQNSYCWWTKSCISWDVWNPVNNGISYLSTGERRISSINSITRSFIPTKRLHFASLAAELIISQRCSKLCAVLRWQEAKRNKRRRAWARGRKQKGKTFCSLVKCWVGTCEFWLLC